MPIKYEECPECKMNMKPSVIEQHTKEYNGEKYISSITVLWVCEKDEPPISSRDSHTIRVRRTYGITKEIGKIEA
jgi:hypothetical protein